MTRRRRPPSSGPWTRPQALGERKGKAMELVALVALCAALTVALYWHQHR